MQESYQDEAYRSKHYLYAFNLTTVDGYLTMYFYRSLAYLKRKKKVISATWSGQLMWNNGTSRRVVNEARPESLTEKTLNESSLAKDTFYLFRKGGCKRLIISLIVGSR